MSCVFEEPCDLGREIRVEEGDMREWFDLVSAARVDPDPPTCRAFPKKRLKGFEPSTFCMAIRPVSENRVPRK